jgi:hypothetical protein
MKMLFSESTMRPYRPRHRRPVLRPLLKKLALAAAAAMRRRAGTQPRFGLARTMLK